jgi:hypothetical protein
VISRSPIRTLALLERRTLNPIARRRGPIDGHPPAHVCGNVRLVDALLRVARRRHRATRESAAPVFVTIPAPESSRAKLWKRRFRSVRGRG